MPIDAPGGLFSTRGGVSAPGQVCHLAPGSGARFTEKARLADVDFPAGGVSAAKGGDVHVVVVAIARP